MVLHRIDEAKVLVNQYSLLIHYFCEAVKMVRVPQINVPTFVILLPVLLPLIAMTPVLDVDPHVKVTPLMHGNLFKKLGLVYVGSAYGHLVVPIHLKELR